MQLIKDHYCQYFSVPLFKGLPLEVKVFPKQTREDSPQFLSSSPHVLPRGHSFRRVRQQHSTTLLDADVISTVRSGDGLFTKTPGLALWITHSDCQAAVFYDPVHHVLANVHCGWRGLVGGIYAVTVKKLFQNYRTDPKTLKVAISPSLGLQASEFVSYKTIFPKSFQQFMHDGNLFDLKGIAKKQLLSLGILEDNLHISEICSYQSELFFSYRRRQKRGEDQKGCKHGNWTAAMLLPLE